MTAPPRLATWLLERTLAAPERDVLLGDLWEEFTDHVLPAHGRTRASIWYFRQAVRALGPLFVRTWERASVGNATTAVLGAGLLATGPAVALLALRSFVLQQVPLKTTADMSVEFAVVLAAVTLVSSVCGVLAAIDVLNTDTRNR